MLQFLQQYLIKKVKVVILSGDTIEIPIYYFNSIHLSKKTSEMYLKKPWVQYKGKTTIAEFAGLFLFRELGWNGVWVKQWGGVEFLTDFNCPIALDQLPEQVRVSLQNIEQSRQSYSGCWDLILWNGQEVLFAELKHKDNLNKNQIAWLSESVNCHEYKYNFVIVEWG